MSDLSAIPVAVVAEPPVIHRLGEVPYAPTLECMRAFTLARASNTRDELWLLEHPPVYTAGIAAKTEHWPRINNGIPVLRIDRGGQITYHGPGQLIAYLLLDLRRRNLSVRPLVRRMEQAVIDVLAGYGITAQGKPEAPGVYVGDAKIAALGLRVRNGCCYHGLALNVDVDLAPFQAINPCGYPGLEVTRTLDLGITDSRAQIGERLLHCLLEKLQ
jgi:lipoyl(octanoyl) transferase